MPINIVELTNIPPELRATAFVPPSFDNHEEKERNIYREEDTTVISKIILNILRHHDKSINNFLSKKSPIEEVIFDMAHGICLKSIGV